jgi:hypothetical protein
VSHHERFTKSVERRKRVIIKENYGEIVINKKSKSLDKNSIQRNSLDVGLEKKTVEPPFMCAPLTLPR